MRSSDGACDDSGVEPRFPTVAEVSATYLASSATSTAEFTTTQDGETIDWLASGGILELELVADGTTSGRTRTRSSATCRSR